MVRLIILVLIIIGGIWMFRACENDGEKVEFAAKEQNDVKSPREAKEGREEKSRQTEAKKRKEEEKTILAGKDKDNEDKTMDDKDADTKDTDKKSWSQKLADKIKGSEKTDASGDKTAATGSDNTNGSVAPSGESTYGTLNNTTTSSASTAAQQVVVPNRDSYLKVYVYENNIDTFGKPPSTGRVHFEVTNSGEWSQNVSIEGVGSLGKVRAGETVSFVVDFAESGTFYIQSYSAVGGAERVMPVVD